MERKEKERKGKEGMKMKSILSKEQKAKRPMKEKKETFIYNTVKSPSNLILSPSPHQNLPKASYLTRKEKSEKTSSLAARDLTFRFYSSWVCPKKKPLPPNQIPRYKRRKGKEKGRTETEIGRRNARNIYKVGR